MSSLNYKLLLVVLIVLLMDAAIVWLFMAYA
jgi:hypothetical protein